MPRMEVQENQPWPHLDLGVQPPGQGTYMCVAESPQSGVLCYGSLIKLIHSFNKHSTSTQLEILRVHLEIRTPLLCIFT